MNRLHTLLFVLATTLLAVTNCCARSIVNSMTLMETPARQAASIYPPVPSDAVGTAVGTMFPELVEKPAIGAVRSPVDVLGEIEETIQNANIGEPSLRNPVPESALRNLQTSLAEQGVELTPDELSAAVDYAHALMRESTNASLYAKVMESLGSERAAFHGNVAELREAGERNMVLTKDTQSEHFDLTEAKVVARSAQLKVYKDPARGLQEMIEDLRETPEASGRYGIMPRDSLLELEERGLVYRRTIGDGEFFIPREEPSIKLMPTKSFSTYGESVDYAERGRAILQQVRGASGEAAESVAEGGFAMESAAGVEGGVEGGTVGATEGLSSVLVVGSKALGIVGAAAAVGFEGYNLSEWINGHISTRRFTESSASLGGGIAGWIAVGSYEWFNGHMSTRRFTESSASLGGGIAGGFGGAWAGAAAGGAVGSFIGPEGTPVGAFIGGIIGGIAGGWTGSVAADYAVGSYYQFEDNKFGRQQQRELRQFLIRYYSHPAPRGP